LSVNASGHVGEVGLNGRGQMVMRMAVGVFRALNINTGETTQVFPSRPLVVATQSGQGHLVKGENVSETHQNFSWLTD
jgi:hypothetical protein